MAIVIHNSEYEDNDPLVDQVIEERNLTDKPKLLDKYIPFLTENMQPKPMYSRSIDNELPRDLFKRYQDKNVANLLQYIQLEEPLKPLDMNKTDDI